MKKLLIPFGLMVTVQANASFQLGQVTEVAIGHESATFQLDTSNGLDNRETCLDPVKPVNFLIDLTSAGGVVLLEQVLRAKGSGSKLAVNGDGNCLGDETEKLEQLVPQ